MYFFCCIFSETRYDGEMISKRRIYQEFQTEEGNGVEGGGGGVREGKYQRNLDEIFSES